MVATTVGAGLFGLPYVVSRAGLVVGVGYLIGVSAAVIFAHTLYFKTLEAVGERKRLLGLVKEKFGSMWGTLAFVNILGGLVLALVAYLILAGQLTELLFPGGWIWGVLGFWLAASIPIILSLRRMVAAELIGGVIIVGAILVIFFAAWGSDIREAPAFNVASAFLPFGVVLFALTGWTAVEPIMDYGKKARAPSSLLLRGMAWGTVLSAALYLLFAIGIIYSAPLITEDTISGIVGWPLWKFSLLILLALFAIWTSYVPIGLEIRNALFHDARMSSALSALFVFAAPPVLLFLGLKDFLGVIGLAGSVFLGLEYVFIFFVAKSVLRLRGVAYGAAAVLAGLFLLGACYEVYTFLS